MAHDSQAGPGDDIDLTQFYQVFFDEAADNLASFEQLLLGLDPAAPGDETLNAIFRCAHSVKGGAATFGFADVAQLTHAMETLLDKLRRHELAASAEMVDTLLQSGDQLRALLHCHQHGGEAPDAEPIRAALARHAEGGGSAPAPAAVAVTVQVPQPAAAAPQGLRDVEMFVGPGVPAGTADDLTELFGEVTGGGKLEPQPSDAEGVLRFRLQTAASDADILDLCSFHVPREKIRITAWPQAAAAPEPEPVAAAPAPAQPVVSAPAAAPASAGAKRAASASGETVRVSIEKVDQLINLMGELVITQAVLAQRFSALDPRSRQQLLGGLGDLERATRDLQESVMSIRMIPMADVFNRFPRMLRDLAAKLGKQVELRTVGEATEMDKGLIEKITDPLTHLVRNAVDHGIETPADRIAAGKPAQGTLTLSARHEGGCIVIEVRDDGRGLDRERLLAKARRNGMVLPEGTPDAEVYQLIFAPGFSTAEQVTDVSGRGVGMDVVRKNILGLNGTVELESQLGSGTCVRVRLPLTLAIMDGMSVGIGDELYLLPLGSVVESFQPQPGAVRTMTSGHRVVKVRDEHLPVVSLGAVVGGEAAGASMLVLLQSEGRTVALEVERLVGRQQVVVKNLETNYRKVPGVSGATVMGDGSVALILDVAAIARRTASEAAAGSSSAARSRIPVEPLTA